MLLALSKGRSLQIQNRSIWPGEQYKIGGRDEKTCMNLGQGKLEGSAALHLVPGTVFTPQSNIVTRYKEGFWEFLNMTKDKMFPAISISSKPSLSILSPSLLVERQAGFSLRCTLWPSTNCIWNEIGKRQRERVTSHQNIYVFIHDPRATPENTHPKTFNSDPFTS